MSVPDLHALIHYRLQHNPQHLRGLAQLLVDEVLERPLGEWIEPTWWADWLTRGMIQLADAQLETWLEQRIAQARSAPTLRQFTPRDELSDEVLESLRRIMLRPHVPDHQLLSRICDHPAIHEIVRSLLQSSLTDFTEKLRSQAALGSAVGETLGGALGGALGGRGKTFSKWVRATQDVAGVVGAQVERQMEGRVRSFVDGAISMGTAQVVDHLCTPERAGELAQWRADSLEVLLDQPVDFWLREWDKLDPQSLLQELTTLARSLVHSPGLREQVESLLQQSLEQVGDQSLLSFFEGSGAEETMRQQLQELVEARARDFVRSPGFEGWLSELVSG